MAAEPDVRHSSEEMPATGWGFHGGSSLSVHRAFVVHFGTGGGPRRRFHGRVEHLSSGRTARFSSLKALLGFVAVVLDGSQSAAPRSPTDCTRTTTIPAGARPSRKQRAGRTGVVGRPR
jgi:hypothetical protein